MGPTLVIESDPGSTPPPDLEVEDLGDEPQSDDDSDAESVTSALGVEDDTAGGSDEESDNDAGAGSDDEDEEGESDVEDAASGDESTIPKTLPPIVTTGAPKVPTALVIETDDDEDLTDSDDEDWSERLKQGGLIAEDGTLGSELLAEHPETRTINVDEVRAAANIIRSSTGVIIDPNHTTTPLITRYEKAKILGIRAEQLSGGGQPAIAISNDGMTSMEIAYAEYQARKIPFIIRRPLPSGKSEYWRVADLQDVSY